MERNARIGLKISENPIKSVTEIFSKNINYETQ
jgi:hypothetical protein